MAATALLAGGLAMMAACGAAEPEHPPDREAGVAGAAPVEGRSDGSGTPSPDGVVADPEDWRILARTVRRARAMGLDTTSIGRAVAGIGLEFVGTPYVPKTLEVPGPERTVVNFRGMDCVTFVESVLAVAWVARRPEVDPGDAAALARAYAGALTRLRYRRGVRDGYASRLHYFSEWLADAEAKGFVRRITPELAGAVEDPEPVDFMTGHPDAYRQLADPGVVERIGEVEERLSRSPRIFVPQARIPEVVHRIRPGDVIAATSAVGGLDVAHTGIAVVRDGAVHLLHAPLVGDSVHVSARPLARRIAGIEGQDGLMVARPLDAPDAGEAVSEATSPDE